MNKKNLLLTISAIVLLLLYFPTNRPVGEIRSFYVRFDDYIPLLTYFVVPYISYYFLLIFALLFLAKKGNENALTKTLFALHITLIAAYLFYYFFQNSINRPEINPQNIFDQIYLLINQNIPPYNAFPSLHVAISTVILFGFKIAKIKNFGWYVLWIALIIISTVFTKQHYVLDIPGGLLLAAVSAFCASKLRY